MVQSRERLFREPFRDLIAVHLSRDVRHVGARTLPSQTHHHRLRQRMRHNLPRRELTRGRTSLTIVRPHARDVKLSIPSLGAPPRERRLVRTRRRRTRTSPVSGSSSSDRFVCVVPPRTPLVATRSYLPVSSRTVLDSRVPRRRAPSARPRARASIARARTSRTTPADARAIHPPRRRRVRVHENGPLSLARASSPPAAARARVGDDARRRITAPRDDPRVDAGASRVTSHDS